jgi:hypothetical protein
MSSYEMKDNTKPTLEELKAAIERGLRAIGMAAEKNAKKDPNMPVRTGLARNSITWALSGEGANTKEYRATQGEGSGTYEGVAPSDEDKCVYIGSNVEYFPDIELGSLTMEARHVLKRAATEHEKEYKKLMQESIENA